MNNAFPLKVIRQFIITVFNTIVSAKHCNTKTSLFFNYSFKVNKMGTNVRFILQRITKGLPSVVFGEGEQIASSAPAGYLIGPTMSL